MTVKDSKKIWMDVLVSMLTGIGVIISVTSISTYFNTPSIKIASDKIVSENIRRLSDSLRTQNERLLVISELLKKDSLVIPNTELTKLKELRLDVDELKKSTKNIQDIIIESPEKALTLPLLKQEIYQKNEQYNSQLLSVKEEFARVYDMLKWIIGLVITMFISLLVLVIGNLFSKTKGV